MIPPSQSAARAAATAACLAMLLTAASAAAQQREPPRPPAARDTARVAHGIDSTSTTEHRDCFRFTFGEWTPALDWRAAGHRAPRDTLGTDRRIAADSIPTRRTVGGRDSMGPAGGGAGDGGPNWATTVTLAGDSLLMLLPPWWPAGVLIEIPTHSPAAGDTLIGRAIAFVADGAAEPPKSAVSVWRVACAGR